MRFDRLLLAAFLALIPLLIWSCKTVVCEPGGTQVCVCPGDLEGAQECSDDGTRWGDCDCGEADDDDSATDDDDVQPDDDDVQPDDDDVQPDDDDVQPDDDDVQPDDDDVQPDDDDVQPDDDDVQPDDDDSGPADDDDSGGPPDGPVDCSDGMGGADQTVCEVPANCPFGLGCTCWDGGGGFYFCAPNCITTADCPVGGPVTLTCNAQGVCVP